MSKLATSDKEKSEFRAVFGERKAVSKLGQFSNIFIFPAYHMQHLPACRPLIERHANMALPTPIEKVAEKRIHQKWRVVERVKRSE